MFSSLASFIFGSNTSATTTTSEANHNPRRQQQEPERGGSNRSERIEAENTIQVTSSTPSVTGTSSAIGRQGKRGRNKRNRYNNKNRRQGQEPKPKQAQGEENKPETRSITKLLTPNDSFDEEFDEDDWLIVEKEDEQESLPRTDSEEELSIVEVKPKPQAEQAPPAGNSASQQRRRPYINSHSSYCGPRPQQQRNFLQRSRNNGAHSGAPLSVSTLSPPRSIAGVVGADAAAADGGVTQSLYAVPPSNTEGSHSANSSGAGANISMEESWFVTPPPCFTSHGPIHMETSPFENLLIEHPSMSVYHSIRLAQEAAESFVNLDLGVVEESQQQRQEASAAAPAVQGRNTPVAQERRSPSVRIDHYGGTQLKQDLFARNAQKSRVRDNRQNLNRGAIKRANKVRDFQGKGNRQRRSEMQHCKVVSGANNNRKSHF